MAPLKIFAKVGVASGMLNVLNGKEIQRSRSRKAAKTAGDMPK